MLGNISVPRGSMSHLSALAEGCDARWAELSEQQGAGASEGAGEEAESPSADQTH